MVAKIEITRTDKMMKEKILIYEKDGDILRALRSFFEKRKNFNARFVTDVASLKRLTTGGEKDLIYIVNVDEVDRVRPSELRRPVIATISSRSAGAGIRRAFRHGVEQYIIHPFHAEDLECKIDLALKGNHVVEQLRKEADDLLTIAGLTSLMSSTLDPQEILYLIVKKISEIMWVTRCSIIRVSPGQRYAHVVSTFEDRHLTNIRLDLNKYPEIRKTLMSKRPVVIKDASRDPVMKRVRSIITPLGIRSIVVIPIVFREEIIGTLFLRTSRADCVFSEREVKLCSAIADASANALYNAFLYEKMEDEKTRLEHLSITDYLTGVYNIRYFYHRLGEEFSRAQRYGLDLSCLMIDIDHFKEINDTYGHNTGDIVLREFAQLIKKHTRKSDVFARYGGEEFIMLLLQTGKAAAVSKAEAIRALVEKKTFRRMKGKGSLSVSIGVATYPAHKTEDKDDLISLADNALYLAKKSGRNRVKVHKP